VACLTLVWQVAIVNPAALFLPDVASFNFHTLPLPRDVVRM